MADLSNEREREPRRSRPIEEPVPETLPSEPQTERPDTFREETAEPTTISPDRVEKQNGEEDPPPPG